METIEITLEAQALIKEIKSIKKSKLINPLLTEVAEIIEKQLESLAIQINFLKEENKRLNHL